MRRSKTSLEYLNAWNRLDKGLSIVQAERNGIQEGLGCVSAFGLVELKKMAKDFTRLTKTKKQRFCLKTFIAGTAKIVLNQDGMIIAINRIYAR